MTLVFVLSKSSASKLFFIFLNYMFHYCQDWKFVHIISQLQNIARFTYKIECTSTIFPCHSRTRNPETQSGTVWTI